MLACSICIGPFLNLVAILHCSTAPVGLCNTLHLLWGFPDISVGKESGCSAGDPSSIPGWGRSPGEGNNGYPFQHSCLENSTDCIVHGITKSRTQLSNFHQQARKTLKTLENDKTKPLIGGPGSIQCYGWSNHWRAETKRWFCSYEKQLYKIKKFTWIEIVVLVAIRCPRL